MPETNTTTNRKLPFPTSKDFVDEAPAEFEALAKAIDEENRGEIDFLQAGVAQATDWSFTAGMENSGTCALDSTAEVAASVCWLPLTAIGLVRSVTPKASIKALKPASLPGAGKYMTVGIELTPTTSDAAATVSVVSGTEQATQVAAQEHVPATTAGKLRIRNVVILNTAGVYSIVAQADVRPCCRYGGQTGDLLFSSATSRIGCLPCEGQEANRVSYANLFAEIGTAYGAGNGTTTFNVPDHRGRAPIGTGTGAGLTARARGEKLGEETHTLDNAEIGAGAVQTQNGNQQFVLAPASASAHNNMQPSLVCNVWIKF